MFSKFNIAHRISSNFKIDWRNIPWREWSKFMRIQKNLIKYDNMSPGSKLIYSLPFAHYFIKTYLVIVPIGSVCLLSVIAYHNKRFLSLTEKDFINSGFVKKPHEYYVFLAAILGLVIISIKLTHDWPIRIYRGQNNQYTAIFIDKMLPLKITKYKFEEVSKANTWKLSPWHVCKHILDGKRKVGLFDHHIEPPIEYFQMMTPKNLRKSH